VAIFLDTTGQPTLGVGICARCQRKFPLAQLISDPNSPGLKVCLEDADEYDPYRLPPRAPDQINLPFVRPDVSLAPDVDTIPLTGTPADLGNLLTWNPVNLIENDPYVIYRKAPGGEFEFLYTGIVGQGNSYLDTDVTEDVTYLYYMTGLDLGGRTIRSNQVSVLTNLADWLLWESPDGVLAVDATDLFIWED
jgi:hypothetical protein